MSIVEGGHETRLLEALPLAAAVVDEAGILVQAGPTFLTTIGHADETLAGTAVVDLASPMGDRQATLGELMAGGRAGTWEGPLLDATHTELWCELAVSAGDGAWSAGHRVLQVRLMPDHWRVQIAEARRIVARLVGQSATVEGALAAILQPIAQTLDFEIAAAWTEEAEQRELVCRSVWRAAGTAPDTGTRVRGSGAGDGAWAHRGWEAGRPVAGDEPSPAPQPGDVHCGVAFPLRAGAESVAVIELLSTRRRRFSADFLDAFATLGDEIAELLLGKRTAELDREGGQLLLVEDNALIARLVSEMLLDSALDLELVHVDRLSAARERLGNWRPACVLLDLTLPDAHGLQALVEIRRLAPEVPIVVLTGHDDDQLAVRAVQEGAQDYLSKRRVDMDSLVRSIRYSIERKGAEQQRLERRLRDRLTGLPSRLLFLDRLRVALRRNNSGAVAVLLLNLDRFRLINDSLGHEAGDHLLREMAERLVSVAGPETTVAGFGADEFAVLLELDEAELRAVELAQQLVDVVADRAVVSGEEIAVQATVGIAINHGEELDALTIVEHADTALSRGKQLGGARFEVFDSAVRERLRAQLQLESGIRQAIEGDQLRLHYQPLLDLRDRTVFGFEALVRWEHPERGLLPPAAFMASAEQTGLVVGLGRWVLNEAARQLAVWRSTLPNARALVMNVNLSGRQLADPGLFEDLVTGVQAAGLVPSDICLEVTETSLIEDVEGSRTIVAGLKEAGFSIALDDFGTGYSSLSYLQRFSVDMIKLDRSFVAALRERGEQAIVAAVAGMSEALGLPVLAEGVEEEQDVERLSALGYGLAQGYWFGKPQAPKEIEAMFIGRRELQIGT